MFRAALRLVIVVAFGSFPCLAAGEWSAARSAHFEVYTQSGLENARTMLAWFERLHAFFAQQTGWNVDNRLPVRVIAFRSAEEFDLYRLRPSADAYYVATEDRDFIVLSGSEAGDIRMAAHEYWHFVEHAQGLRLPAWLNEGLAEFFSTVRLTRDGRIGGEVPGHVKALRTHGWIPLADVLSMPLEAPASGKRDASEMFYAESWALTHMLVRAPDYAPHFSDLVARMGLETSGPELLRSIYGKRLETIARDMRGWIEKGRFTPLVVPGASPEPTAAEVLETSGFVVRAFLADIMLATGRRDRGEELYRGLAAERPDDAQASAGLAIWALKGHETQEALRQWHRALRAGINDAKACYRFAKLADMAGIESADVRPALERAVALQPDFDDAHYSLALLENQAGEHEAALAQLKAMRNVIPERRFSYWTLTFDALNELGRRAEAIEAAETAMAAAATDDERGYAERLKLTAETDMAVRFARDSEGNMRLETTRAPHDSAEWNPFIEPGDRLRRVEARLREIECANAATTFVVDAPSGVLRLRVNDPKHVQMRHAPPEFTCGPQAEGDVVAEYAETGPGSGLLRGLEFR